MNRVRALDTPPSLHPAMTSGMKAAELFAKCPLAGCANLTDDPRHPCSECMAICAAYIRPSGQDVSAEQFAAASAEGDRQVAAVLAERAALFEVAR